MASAFSHTLVAITLGKIYPHHKTVLRLWSLAILCAILPDIDVLWHQLGVPYSSVWGHRGFTHSLFFAFISALLVSRLGFSRIRIRSLDYWRLVLFFFLVTASHGVLDAMTNGGLGIAFFAPFDDSRFFMPWRPLAVSPIGIRAFFSEWGWNVIKSELIWVGIPCLLLLLGFRPRFTRR